RWCRKYLRIHNVVSGIPLLAHSCNAAIVGESSSPLCRNASVRVEMSGLHAKFKTDRVKEVEGVAIEFSDAPNDDGSIPTFTISRMGKTNRAYSKALEQATRPYRRQIEL